MNIAIVTTWFERGAAYVSKQIADTLVSQGNSVFIYARGGEQASSTAAPWIDYRVTIDTTPRLPMPTGMNKKSFKHFLLQNSIDLVIFNEQRYWAPIIWAKELKIPCVAYIDYYTKKTVELFKAYDAVICNTKRHLSVFDAHPNCLYIPWGTDINLFKPTNTESDKEKYTFFHSAGMNPYRKGTDLFIRSIAELSKSNKDFNALIHTQVSLERFFPSLQNQILDLKRQKILTIEQRTIPAPGLYHKGKIYVYPSRLDGIGLTVPEALAAGLPVITTDSAPMNEFIDNNSGELIKIESTAGRADGYFWPETTCRVDSLTEKMSGYCNLHEKIAIQSTLARKHATDQLDWNSNSKSLSELLTPIDSEVLSPEIAKALKCEDENSVRFYESLKFLYNPILRIAFSVKKHLK